MRFLVALIECGVHWLVFSCHSPTHMYVLRRTTCRGCFCRGRGRAASMTHCPFKPPTISTCLFPNTCPSRRRRTCRTCFRRDRGGAVRMMRHLQKKKKRTAQKGLLLLTWVCRVNPTRRRYLACSDCLCILYQVNILPAGHFGCSLLCPSELFVGDPLYSLRCTCGCSV